MQLDAQAFSSKVARRAFGLFVACALLPITILALISLRQVTSELRGQNERRQRQACKAVGLLLHKRLLALDAAIEPYAQELERQADEDLEPPFLGVVLVGADGQSRPVSGRVSALPALTAEQMRILTAGETVLTTEVAEAKPVRYFLSRALARSHPENGILRGEINPAYIWQIEDEVTLEFGTKLLVMDESGKRLVSSLGFGEEPPTVKARARVGSAGQFTWADDRHTYLASYWTLFLKNRFHTPNWTIVLSRDTTEIFAPLGDFRRNFVLIAILSLLVVLLLSFGQIRRILFPLGQLQEATRRLALGRLDTRVEVKSRDEFENLAGSFNQMAAQLGRQFDALTLRSELTVALSRNENSDATLQTCMEIVVRHLDLALAGIWLSGKDERLIERRAVAGTARPLEGTLEIVRVGEGQIGRVAAEGRPLAVSLSPQDPRWTHSPWSTREGIVSFVGHPLVIEGRIQGVAAAFATRNLDTIDLGILASAVAEIAQGIARWRVAEALRKSEEQVRQLQKMEAVGRLAGGVAHDFNNLLTVILGYCQLMNSDLAPDSPLREGTQVIEKTAVRAAQLTKQLLAFSRKQVLAPKVLDLNTVISGMSSILNRLIGESIELAVVPLPQPALIKVDPGQMEQVIVNLVVNARDAMPHGGKITLTTESVDLTEAQAAQHSGLRPGPHIVLKVRDTGTGMDAATRARIFEPFFTTKAPGKGTGLGLATVYGIIAQSGGSIDVESEVGKGSTFLFHFPRSAGVVEAETPTSLSPLRGTETVLLVEDEYDVRILLQKGLSDYGYRVLCAGRPTDALRMAEEHAGRIHLLITDMVMPEMSGAVLIERLKAARADLAVIQMSGYTEYRSESVASEASPPIFLQKPFTPETLAREVRAVLDSLAPAAAV